VRGLLLLLLLLLLLRHSTSDRANELSFSKSAQRRRCVTVQTP
jgi:hypothetical protein